MKTKLIVAGLSFFSMLISCNRNNESDAETAKDITRLEKDINSLDTKNTAFQTTDKGKEESKYPLPISR